MSQAQCCSSAARMIPQGNLRHHRVVFFETRRTRPLWTLEAMAVMPEWTWRRIQIDAACLLDGWKLHSRTAGPAHDRPASSFLNSPESPRALSWIFWEGVEAPGDI